MTALNLEELNLWSHYIHSLCGLQIDGSKGYLVETRLGPLMREAGCSSFIELYHRAKMDASNGLKRKIIDSITTQETSFFRDASPFELLQHKVVPDLIDRRGNSPGAGRILPVRIWSAACSTGQEVYTTAIVLKELLGDLSRYDIRILGTDISNKAVARASDAKYTRLELDRGMTDARVARYFVHEGQGWKVRDEIRALATFKTMNLLDPFPFLQKFDLVLCRNVALYFSEQDKVRLFKAISKVLAPDGYLMVGGTETITALCPEFEAGRHLGAIYYQLKGA